VRRVFENEVRPIEIVISDNAFSEESAAATRLFRPPEGIVLRHIPNAGEPTPSENVRNALRAATHERIVLMHDDDYMLPGGIDALVAGWDARNDDVDAVYGRQLIVQADGETDREATDYYDTLRFKNKDFGPQASKLRAALSQQFPNNGMLMRRSIFERIGYPDERDVGRIPVDLIFGIRYALASTRPFVLVDNYVSAYRLTEQSILRDNTASRIYDGHLGYAALESIATATDSERDAKKTALALLAPLAVAGYLKVGEPRKALGVFRSNFWRMEKAPAAKAALFLLIVLGLIGLRPMDRFGSTISATYNFIYKRGKRRNL